MKKYSFLFSHNFQHSLWPWNSLSIDIAVKPITWLPNNITYHILFFWQFGYILFFLLYVVKRMEVLLWSQHHNWFHDYKFPFNLNSLLYRYATIIPRLVRKHSLYFLLATLHINPFLGDIFSLCSTFMFFFDSQRLMEVDIKYKDVI